MAIRAGLPVPPATSGGSVTTLYRHHAVPTPVQYRPRSVGELVASVIDAGARGDKVRAGGSYYSLSAAAMPDEAAVQTRALLDRHLARPASLSREALPADRYATVNHGQVELESLISPDWRVRNRDSHLVFCEAGVQLRLLMRDLTTLGLALPTMGSGSTQTLAGAISTGTHGSDWALPPLGDFVRAVHLVGPDGQEWWIQGDDGPIDSLELSRLPHWDAATKFVRSDEMLDAVRVSVGRFGVWYAAIVQVVPQYGLERKTVDMSWSSFVAQLRASVANGYEAPGALLAEGDVRAFEAIYEPNSDVVRVTKRRLRPDVTASTGSSFNSSGEFFQDLLCTPVGAALGVSTALDTAAIVLDGIGGAKSGIPFAGPFLAAPYWAAAVKLRVLATEARTGTLVGAELMTRIIRIFRNDGLPELRTHVAEVLGSIVLDGERELGTFTGLSFEMMDSSASSELSGPVPQQGGRRPCELVDSTEVHFDASDTRAVDYVDALARRFKAQRPVELFFSIRLSGRSSALLATERFAPTMTVEVAALRPFKTSAVLEAAAEGVAAGGILHWGQMRPDSYDATTVEQIFGDDLTTWRRALSFLEAGRPDSSFSTPHSRAVGLEWEGHVNPATARYRVDEPDFEPATVHLLL